MKIKLLLLTTLLIIISISTSQGKTIGLNSVTKGKILGNNELVYALKNYGSSTEDGIYAINSDGTQKWFYQLLRPTKIVFPANFIEKVVWDIHNDGKKGLPEAIDALKVLSHTE